MAAATARGYAVSAGAQASRIWNCGGGGGASSRSGQRLLLSSSLLMPSSRPRELLPHVSGSEVVKASSAVALSASVRSFCHSARATATSIATANGFNRRYSTACPATLPALLVSTPVPTRLALAATRPSLMSKRYSSGDTKMSSPPSLAEVLAGNEAWATGYNTSHPTFFTESAKGQHPKLLWLGCSDSRVPESTILNLPPGAVFTHRNIANIFTSNDISSLSVIEYAVAHVGVQHVVICGHTACGGVAAALANRHIGVIDAWLQPLRALRSRLVRDGKLAADVDPAEKSLRLVEENVREGVRTVRSNPNVIRAARERGVTVHGLIYDLGSGKLRELTVQEEDADVNARIEANTVD